MKHYLIIICILMLITMSLAIPANGAEYFYRVAVLPFEDSSITERSSWSPNFQLGKETADELVTALLQTKRFRLIEREQIDKILREQNLGINGTVDPKTAAKIGKILGVQYLVIGRITQFSSKNDTTVLANPNTKNPMGLVLNTTTAMVAMEARLVDTTSAEVLTSVTGSGEKKNIVLGAATKQGLFVFGSKDFSKSDLGRALRQAVNSVAYQLANQAYDGVTVPTTTINGKVAFADPKNIIINIGTKDGVVQGMVLVVRHLIDQVKDPETGTIVDEVTEPVAEIIVTKVKDRTATCLLSTQLSTKYRIIVSDRVSSKEPVQMAALPPLELPLSDSVTNKGFSGKLYFDTNLVYDYNKNYGSMSMYGGEFKWDSIKIGGERVSSSEIQSSPNGKVDISEIKLGYDLKNDSDTRIELYWSNLFINWNYGAIVNSSMMFGADVGYDISDKTIFEASFGYGFTPSTRVGWIKEDTWTNITTIKVKVGYSITDNLDFYGDYRSYLITRQDDQSLSGIGVGMTFKF